MSNVTNKKAVFMLALSEIRYKTLGQNVPKLFSERSDRIVHKFYSIIYKAYATKIEQLKVGEVK